MWSRSRFEAGGGLLAGTESPGQVLRIDQDGRAFVLLDAPYEEIHTLRTQPDGSVLVVAVNELTASSPTPSSSTDVATTNSVAAPTVTVTTSVTALVVAGAASPSPVRPSTNEAGASPGTKGAVYRIASDGLWDKLWSSDSDTPYDAVFDDTGALLVGTGRDGKIYQVSDDPPRTVLLGRAPALQVTRFLQQTDGSLRYSTANPGRVVRLTRTLAERGTYESEVRDAETVATWGTISWRGATPGGSRIELSSRSGNTAIPNETWSEWSVPYTDAAGTQITSPKARYLQWRASLFAGDASPTLTSVMAAYLPRNLRPEVTQITVHPPGTVFQQPFSSGDPPIAGLKDNDETESKGGAATLGRESYRKGSRRSRGRRPTRTGTRSNTPSPTRGRAKPPGGRWASVYWTRCSHGTPRRCQMALSGQDTVSDARSNAPDTALVGERESPVFDVDNSAPRIEIAAVGKRAGGQSSHSRSGMTSLRYNSWSSGTGATPGRWSTRSTAFLTSWWNGRDRARRPKCGHDHHPRDRRATEHRDRVGTLVVWDTPRAQDRWSTDDAARDRRAAGGGDGRGLPLHRRNSRH